VRPSGSLIAGCIVFYAGSERFAAVGKMICRGSDDVSCVYVVVTSANVSLANSCKRAKNRLQTQREQALESRPPRVRNARDGLLFKRAGYSRQRPCPFFCKASVFALQTLLGQKTDSPRHQPGVVVVAFAAAAPLNSLI